MKSKIGTLILSIVIACGLWAYVMTNINVKGSTSLHNVPVVFQNEGALSDRNLMLTAGTSQTVTLNITGTRSEILKLRPDNVSVVVDLSRIYDSGRQGVNYVVNFPPDVATGDFEYTADKTRIFLTVEDWVEKYVNVVFQYNGQVKEGYMVDQDSLDLDHDSILVSGPASVVAPIHHARFVVDLEDRTEPVDQDFEYILCDDMGEPVEVENIENVHTNVERIHFKLDIQRYKQIELKLNVIGGAGATEETSSIVLDTPTIMVSGPDSLLENLDALTIGSVDLGQIKNQTVMSFSVDMPNGVINRTGVKTVKATISFPALATKTFTITNIHPVNVPADTIGTVVTRQINVTVRGPRSIVQRMLTSDLTVTIDFADMEVGATVTRAPGVTISGNFPDVGLMESGSVTIMLQEKPPETEPPTEPDDQSDTDPDASTENENNGTTR